MTADANMVALFKAELSLCKVGPDQTMAVLSEGEVRADYAQAFMMAGQELGAHCFHVNLTPRVASQGFAGNMGKTAIQGNRDWDISRVILHLWGGSPALRCPPIFHKDTSKYFH